MDLDNLLVVCTNSAGDRKLYALIFNSSGKVFDYKRKGKYIDNSGYVDFVKEDYLSYVYPLTYTGCDIYLAIKGKAGCVIVYLQSGKEPDIYDQIYHVYGAEMPEDIPDKIKPLTPMAKDPVSRPRSKVKQDAYSKE